MATGHLNPGYSKIVTRFKTALDNPDGVRPQVPPNQEELEQIKAKARAVWSVKDTSKTTYGYFHREPELKERATARPSSPTRRNNPHPHLVFLATRLKTLPGYFNIEDNKNGSVADSVETLSNSSYNSKVKLPSVSVYPNANSYLRSIPHNQADVEELKLQEAGVDTKSNNPAQTSRSNNVIYHYSNPNSNRVPSGSNKFENDILQGIDFDFERKINRQSLDKLQSNQTNPYLYDDYRMYKEKYANNDHGLPNPFAKKPFRGDFMIHYDWHPRLKHHKLPYNY